MTGVSCAWSAASEAWKAAWLGGGGAWFMGSVAWDRRAAPADEQHTLRVSLSATWRAKVVASEARALPPPVNPQHSEQ